MLKLPESQHMEDGISLQQLHEHMCDQALQYYTSSCRPYDKRKYLIPTAIEYYRVRGNGPLKPPCEEDCQWLYQQYRQCTYSGKDYACKFNKKYKKD